MVYQCVDCKRKWYTEETDDINTKELSHGICHDCAIVLLSPRIHKKQIAEGNFDCFGKAIENCDQKNCKYLEVCIDPKINYIEVNNDLSSNRQECNH